MTDSSSSEPKLSSQSGKKSRPSVVILGAGFAGLNAAHALKDADVDVTVVDRNNFHTFQPLLYQVATSYLSPEEVGAAIRSIFRRQDNLELKVAEITGVRWEDRTLLGDNGIEIPFDYLVVAAGTVVNYFGIPGMEESAWPLYTLTDSILLRQHLLWRLEQSERPHHQHAEETVVVVGGGPTGVETAGAITGMGRDLLGADEKKLHVVLVEAVPNLLTPFSERSRKKALADLRRRGVEIRLETAVASADADGVTTTTGERIETKTVIWAAGVRASNVAGALELETGRRGSIIVGPDLQVAGKPGVFSAGDVAYVMPEPEGGQPPLLAPNAVQGGKHVAKQIIRLIEGKGTKPYEYHDKGILAVLGRGNAVAEIPVPLLSKARVRFAGRLAWLLWLGVHIVYLVGFRNRLKVMVDWTWNFLTSRGSTALMLRSEELRRRDAAPVAKAADNS